MPRYTASLQVQSELAGLKAELTASIQGWQETKEKLSIRDRDLAEAVASLKDRNQRLADFVADSRQATPPPAPIQNPPDGYAFGDAELRHYFDETAVNDLRAQEYFQTQIVARVGEFSGSIIGIRADGSLTVRLSAYEGSKAAKGFSLLGVGLMRVHNVPAWLATGLNSGDVIRVRAKVSDVSSLDGMESDFADVISVNGRPPKRPAK